LTKFSVAYLIINATQLSLSRDYANPLPAWSGFLSREQVGQINGFLKRIYRCGFSCELIELETLTSAVEW